MNYVQVARDIRHIAKSESAGVINIDSQGEVWHRDFRAARASYCIDLQWHSADDLKKWTAYDVQRYIEDQ